MPAFFYSLEILLALEETVLDLKIADVLGLLFSIQYTLISQQTASITSKSLLLMHRLAVAISALFAAAN
ncbi:hypothetical protein [Cellulophaga baltica]|uniref:hypothetical protein n=1 Tax=Cellulophaga baltica TaxID=76594 RepID=UPI000411CB3C|nr:hypothetical protein [Cellulophaga baltica]WFO16474.1 hypothetical protein M601_001270 [Cellulophaga baltica 4]